MHKTHRKYVAYFLIAVIMTYYTDASSGSLSLDSRTSEIAYVEKISKATHKGLDSMVDPQTGWPINSASISKEGIVIPVFKVVSVDWAGLRMVSIIGARNLGSIDNKEMIAQLEKIVTTFEKVEKWNGFFYQWYSLVKKDASGNPERVQLGDLSEDFIPSLNNAILTASLMVVAEYLDEMATGLRLSNLMTAEITQLKKRCEALIDKQDYSIFYDKKIGFMRLGIEAKPGEKANGVKGSEFHYEHFYTEANLLALIAVASGDVPIDAWDNLRRRKVIYKTEKGRELIFYRSWNGSIYEGVFADIFINYNKNAASSLAASSRNLILAEKDYSNRHGFPFWGWSPAANDPKIYNPVAGNRQPVYYIMWGVSEFGEGIPGGTKAASPYSSLLALKFAPSEAIKNLKKLQEVPGAYSDNYGFVDVIYINGVTPYPCLLSWDQLISEIACQNYISDIKGRNGMDYYFLSYIDKMGKLGRRLLAQSDTADMVISSN